MHLHQRWFFRASSGALVLAAALAARPLAATAQSVSNGKALFEKCLACHSAEAGAAHKTGPNLFGIVGRKVGGADGFGYSDGMQAANASGMVWSVDMLDTYLANPMAFLPRTRMAWAVREERARKDLTAYLETLK